MRKGATFFKKSADVATDPGVLWSICDVLLFAGTNALGALAMGVSALAGLLAKVASVAQPRFLDRETKLARTVKDERMPLRIGGLCCLFVTAATAASGLILPAVTGIFFALTFFTVAESISRAKRGLPDISGADRKLPAWKRVLKLSLTRPDLYTATGLMLAGMMAGGASLWALPLVAAGFGVSMRNIVREKAEHAGHPKLLYAAAGAVFAGVGFTAGAPLIGAAQALNVIVFGIIESRITPGGLRGIARDIGRGIKSLFRVKPGAAKPGAPVAAPAVSSAAPLASSAAVAFDAADRAPPAETSTEIKSRPTP